MQRPHELYPDRPTILMADRARLGGRLLATPADHGAKRFHVSNWKSTEDSFAWTVVAREPIDVEVTLLVAGREAEVELVCNRRTLTMTVNGPWDRIALGSIPLTRGANLISLRALKPGIGLELYSAELIDPIVRRELEEHADRFRSSTAWMREARFGLQFHWTSQSHPRVGQKLPYDEAVTQFDIQAFTSMVRESGAGYVILTTSHAEYYFPAPIKAIDRIMPGRTASRDLIGELIDALGAYGIRLLLYYHVGHEHWNEPDGWWPRCDFDPDRPERFLENWRAIIGEVGRRYGEGLAGWFFDDGCVYYPLNPDFRRLGEAAKAGYPDRIICYNPWIWPRFTDFQDYFCGEGYQWAKTVAHLPADGTGIFQSGPQAGLQAHCNFILEDDWGHFRADSPIGEPRIDLQEFLDQLERTIGRGVVPSVNLEIYQDGTFSERSLEYVRSLSNRLSGGHATSR